MTSTVQAGVMFSGSPSGSRPALTGSGQHSFGADEIALRRTLFGLSADDEPNLDRIRFAIRENLPALVGTFYDHPLSLPGATPAAEAERTMNALRVAQRNYLTTLGLESGSAQYVDGRARIALLHEAAGYDRAWYLGAHATLFQPISCLLARHAVDPTRTLPVLATLHRILAFDCYVVGEAYLDADRRRLERRLQAASESQRAMLAVSRRDDLTDVDSRAFLLETLQDEIERSRRKKHDFSLLFVHVDEFKAINDTFGHAAGDEVLRGIVSIVNRSLRPGDIVGRYGDDEFLVGLLRADQATADRVASRVCQAVASAVRGGRPVTVSIGCATLTANDCLTDLIRRADAAMHAAKARRQVRSSAPVPAATGLEPVVVDRPQAPYRATRQLLPESGGQPSRRVRDARRESTAAPSPGPKAAFVRMTSLEQRARTQPEPPPARGGALAASGAASAPGPDKRSRAAGI